MYRLDLKQVFKQRQHFGIKSPRKRVDMSMCMRSDSESGPRESTVLTRWNAPGETVDNGDLFPCSDKVSDRNPSRLTVSLAQVLLRTLNNLLICIFMNCFRCVEFTVPDSEEFGAKKYKTPG